MSLSFSIQKAWAKDKTTFVLAVATSAPAPIKSVSGATVSIPKKLFLLLQAGHNPVLEVLTEKPDPLTPDHPMTALMRKYALPGQIIGFSWDDKGNLGAHLAAQRGDTLERGSLTLWAGGEWSGEFQWQGVSLCRIGSKGVFTKPKHLDQPFTSPFYAAFSETDANQDFFRHLLLKALGSETEPENTTAPLKDTHESDVSSHLSTGPLLPQTQRDLRDRLSRRLKTLRKALKKLEQHFPSEEDIANQQKIATALQAYSHLVKPGADRLQVPALENDAPDVGQSRTLFLDPEKSIGAQIDAAFLEVKRLHRAREKGQSQINRAHLEISVCEKDLQKIRGDVLATDSLRELAQNHGLGTEKVDRVQISRPREQEAKPFRKFDLGAGFMALVGKNAAGNDELYRLAKGNDFFFHVISPQGSHVIIPAKGRPPLPADIRRMGAILAIHFSKAKQDLASEVYFTQRMHIAKKRGMAPGLVLIQRSETLHVRYDQAELEALIKKEVLA